LRWLKAFGASGQVKDCLDALKTFDADLGEEPAWQLLKLAVAKAIRRNEGLVRSKILHDGILPRDIVLTLAASLSLEALGSGQHHIYRGRLSMTGGSYRVIFSSIVSVQKLLGTISKEDRSQALLNMASAIEDAG
jgi:hypothetical protein